MFRKIGLMVLILSMASVVPALAQEPRVAIDATVGWVFSDGVTGDAVLAGDGNLYDELDPNDGVSFAFSFGYLATPQSEVGFMWSRQMSELQAKGTTTTKIDDMAVDGYHGYYAYNFGESESTVRPYMMFGLGMTRYAGVSFTTFAGQERDIPAQSKFSGTIGGGVKVFPSPNVGVKFGVRWTPTYIKSDAEGWWCDPWWGCYVVGDAQYSNQFEFNGGVAFRF